MFSTRGVHVLNKHAIVTSFFRSTSSVYSRKYSTDDFTAPPDVKTRDLISRIEIREEIYTGTTLSPEEVEKRYCEAKNPFQFFNPELPESPKMFSLDNIRRWKNILIEQKQTYDQRFIPQRHATLGCDLSAAHFIVYRGGRIKRKGHADWIERGVPDHYVPDFFVTTIDCGSLQISYEGLDNLLSLDHLEWLSMKGSSLINDWGLDKISAEYPKLKYLDISDCKNISERGLESLYRMYNLETLIVTNHHKSAAFELTCLMLEDCNPKLSCTIYLPKEESIDK